MDLKSFQKNYQNNAQRKESTPTQEDLKNTAEAYAQKSDDDLLGEIMRNAKQNKRDGTLSESQLKAFVSSVSPMLNQEQRERLQNVVDMINRA